MTVPDGMMLVVPDALHYWTATTDGCDISMLLVFAAKGDTSKDDAPKTATRLSTEHPRLRRHHKSGYSPKIVDP